MPVFFPQQTYEDRNNGVRNLEIWELNRKEDSLEQQAGAILDALLKLANFSAISPMNFIALTERNLMRSIFCSLQNFVFL